MNFSKSINLTLTTILFLVFSNSLFSQKLEPKERITEPDHTISSKIMDRDYQLFISFPRSYSTKDTISYPVLYVLDGKYVFPLLRGTQYWLDTYSEIEDVIIVGIGSEQNRSSWVINRTYDYTTSIDTTTTRNREKGYGFPKGTLKSGGADKFLTCIKNEISPFVDKNYKTNTDRGILGASFGGLFAAYCFLNSDGYFTRFGIVSPSLWWDNEKLLNEAITQFTTDESKDIPKTKVLISVGENEGPSMVPSMVKFSSYLEYVDYENVDLDWHIFDGESHISVGPASVSRALTTLYGVK